MFVRNPVKVYEVNAVFTLCPWIDGDRQRVRVRARYFRDVLDYYTQLDNRRTAISGRVLGLLEDLLPQHSGQDAKTDVYHRFVDDEATEDVVVVFSNVKSTHIVRFCHHLSLHHGRYETELDFLGLPPTRVLEKAGLLPHPVNNATDAEKKANCDSILKVYLWDEVR